MHNNEGFGGGAGILLFLLNCLAHEVLENIMYLIFYPYIAQPYLKVMNKALWEI